VAKGMTLNVRVTGSLSEFVASAVGETGDYENVSEYVRDLIRRDKARSEEQAFERLKAELEHAFKVPASSYREVTSADVVARNADRGK
jgi:antitoxin ParD1/3/4